MMNVKNYIISFPIPEKVIGSLMPWEITGRLPGIIQQMSGLLDQKYSIENGIAIHETAIIEAGAIIKGPAVIGPHCFIASSAYLRNGVFLASSVHIGPGCEIKSSLICQNSNIAHFNYIGDSLIGRDVNFEAGSVIANHFNEREHKRIFVRIDNQKLDTGTEKFGAMVGDSCRIGANAVLSPGTLLKSGTIVKRLELIEQ
jgi:NDP-sugar pyrophosphorylase family protein